MGFFGAGEEFLRKLWCILSALDASSASAVAWLAAVETETADVVFASCGGDVWAGHVTFDPKRGSPLYKFVSKYPLY